MNPVSQWNAADYQALSERNATVFWRDRRYNDLECLWASYGDHQFAPHCHETYVMGVIMRGVEVFRCAGERLKAGPGQFTLLPPHMVHDGKALSDTGYEYRMLYPAIPLVSGLLGEFRDSPGPLVFRPRSLVIDDPVLSRETVRLHQSLQRQLPQLATDEGFFRVMRRLAECHGVERFRDVAPGSEKRSVRRAVEYIDAYYSRSPSVAELAEIACLSKYYFIRAFSRHVGLTPYAYLVNRRVNAALRLLSRGYLPADAATASGFCDQSHMINAIRQRRGITPGKYVADVRPR
jgi:AraC-like DNA-binding protein